MGGEEGGNVTIMALLFIGSLTLALILALESACAYAQKTALDNCLNIAREETFSPGFDMQIKSSDDPGGLIARKITGSLRQNGYEGAIEIQFYEATADEIEDSNPEIDSAENARVLVYQVIAKQAYANVVAPVEWFANTFLASSVTASLCPYSLHKTYRPDNVAGNVWSYEIAPGSSEAPEGEQDQSNQMWQALSSTLQSALAKPTEIYNANK